MTTCPHCTRPVDKAVANAPSATSHVDGWLLYCDAFRSMFNRGPGQHEDVSVAAIQVMVSGLIEKLSAPSETPRNTESDTYLGALITEYHNTSFDCGQWDEEDGTKYEDVQRACHEAKRKLLEEIARVRTSAASETPQKIVSDLAYAEGFLSEAAQDFGPKWVEIHAKVKAALDHVSAPSAIGQRDFEDERRRNQTLVLALTEIMKGEGPFSRDPLTHATSTIESMKKLATDALYATGNL